MELKTVGDAAAEYANKKYATDKGYPEEDWYISWLSFREGAKWQEEKMYNEEEVRQAQQAILGNIKDALMNKDYSIEYLNQNKTK